MYATSQGDKVSVITAALRPELADRQIVSGASDRLEPSDPLILTEDKEKHVVWILHKFEAPGGMKDAYTLHADIGIIGSTWYAGTNARKEIVIIPVPVVPDVPADVIPYWVLKKH